jgi:hypothetical protein
MAGIEKIYFGQILLLLLFQFADIPEIITG